MRFQAKLNIFFAFNVILPIALATALTAVLYSRWATNDAYARLGDRVNTASIVIDTQKQVLLTEAEARLDERPDLVSGITSGNVGRSAASLGEAARGLEVPYAALLDTNGNVLAQTSAPQDIGGCVISAKVSLRTAGNNITGYFVASKRLDRQFLQEMLGRIGEQSAISCTGGIEASTFTGRAEGGTAAPIPLPSTAPTGQTGITTIGDIEYLTYQYSKPDDFLTPLTIVAGVPKEQIWSRVSILLGAGLSLIILTLFVATLLAFLATRSITKPLSRLTGAAVRAQGGDLDYRVDIDSRDEIGVLAGSFSVMCTRLREYINQLKDSRNRLRQALTYASDMLGSGYDRERLTAVVTDTLSFATQSSAAGFFLLEAKKFEPEPEAVQLTPPGFFKGKIRNSVEQTIREIGKGKVKGLVSLREDGFQIIFAPLTVKSGPRGALVAAFNEEVATDEPICSIIQSLANQAATALENMDLNEALHEMVITDSLTGLRNIRYFNSRFASEVEMGQRHDSPVSLIVMDLDDFKSINDIYGHQVGDEVLRQVGLHLGASIRKSDVAARYGGEEFAVILPQTTRKTAVEVTEKIRGKINQLRIRGYPEIKIGFSAGVASFPEDAIEGEALLRAADAAAYRAKRMGKNRTVAA